MRVEKLYEILLSDKPSDLIKSHEEEIFNMIPELRICKGFNQNNIWHVYDVYEHILHVVDEVDKDLVLRLSALFHDIAKPVVYTEDANGVGHFPFHWVESAKIFDSFVEKYSVDKALADEVRKLIMFHDANIAKLDGLRLNDFLKAIDNESIVRKLYNLKRADLLAQNKQFHYILSMYDDLENDTLNMISKK